MDLLKNRETPEDGIPRRLPADTAEAAVITEAEAIAALQQFPQLWEQLFPGEQARIIQRLVRRVTMTAEGLVIDLRTDSVAGVMPEMVTPRQLEAAE